LIKKGKHTSGIEIYAALFLLLLLASCASYYDRSQELMRAVYTNNLESAQRILDDDVKWEKKEKNVLLFYLNKGTVLWMAGKNVESNIYFQKADLFVEDYNKKVGDAVLTMLVNANLTTYHGENFEQIMLHYYGALNYLQLGNLDAALVEGKRMLQKMQRITDSYKRENKYKRDAFAHNLLGMIYDARKEYNDAFIAYKNAYEVYKEDYLPQLQTPIPNQLKLDLLRTAYLTGFYDEVRYFEKEFNFSYAKPEGNGKNKSEVLVLWNNGLGPVKDQLSITISIIPYSNGWVQFINHEMGISIPFYVGEQDQKDLLDMRFFRLALPKYVSRLPYYESAKVKVRDQEYGFSLAQDINAIAYKSLQDRMLKELSVGLLRVALKQLAAYKLRQNKDTQGAAFAASIYSVASEQADTRNWQLLPHSIAYTRISLDSGEQKLDFEAYHASDKKVNKELVVKLKQNETKFVTIQTPEFSGYSQR
jgi:hypothetical protein